MGDSSKTQTRVETDYLTVLRNYELWLHLVDVYEAAK